MTNKEIVEGFIEEVLNNYKFDRLDEFVASNFQTHSLHLNPKPVTVDNPPKTFKDALIQSHKALAEFNRKIEEVIENDDKVVVRHTTAALHIGNFMGIPATNKKISFQGISIYKITNGKISDEWYIWDRLGLYQQLGIDNK